MTKDEALERKAENARELGLDYEPVIDKSAAVRIATALGWTPQRTWVGLMRGVRVEGDTVVISVKGGNDAARELCGALIEEMNR